MSPLLPPLLPPRFPPSSHATPMILPRCLILAVILRLKITKIIHSFTDNKTIDMFRMTDQTRAITAAMTLKLFLHEHSMFITYHEEHKRIMIYAKKELAEAFLGTCIFLSRRSTEALASGNIKPI